MLLLQGYLLGELVSRDGIEGQPLHFGVIELISELFAVESLQFSYSFKLDDELLEVTPALCWGSIEQVFRKELEYFTGSV